MPNDTEERPYKVYRSAPRGLLARLRGEEDGVDPGAPDGPGGGPRWPWRRRHEPGEPPRKVTPLRVLKWIVVAIVSWILLSLVLFLISAETKAGNLPSGAESQLSGGGPSRAGRRHPSRRDPARCGSPGAEPR